ncbi:MAG: hypothetical protein ABI992_08170 [Chthoniobacterales bacterium]
MAAPLSTSNSRPRRTLLWCAVALALSPLPGGWLVDHCPLQHRDPEMAATVSAWQMNEPPPNVLLLGSSRLGSFLRTMEFAQTTQRVVGGSAVRIFNAALVCGEPNTIEFLTRNILAEKKAPPRLAIVEISPDLLARDNTYFKFVITRQLVASDLPEYLPDIVTSGGGISRLAASRLTPFFLHRAQLLDWAAETLGFASTEPAPSGTEAPVEGTRWQAVRDLLDHRKGAAPQRIEAGARRFRSHLRNYQLAGRTSAAFEHTVAMLHEAGAVIVLVQPPLSTAQRALLTPEIKAQFAPFLQRLHSEYGCTFADFSERVPDDLFLDNHHGSNAGSAVFSEMLAREVVGPAWTGRTMEVSQPPPE